MSGLSVLACGPMTSLQDGGRFGWQRYGVSNSGAMDPLALTAANILVGNAPGEAAIECILLGASLRLESGSLRVAVAGTDAAITIEGRPVLPLQSARLRAGETLTIGPAKAGIYAYLAVSGGFAARPQLGSASLHQRAEIGGFNGRPIRPGDTLPLARPEVPGGPDLTLPALPLEPEAPIRVVLGPQDDFFTKAGIETLLSSEYRISPQADRMGYRLSGPKIEHAKGFNIVSDGIATGSIQVPGSGEPIVLLADRQTTGGYPKIATVISADLRVLAHRRPGSVVRFQAIPVAQAQALARERAADLAALPSRLKPAGPALPSVEDLMAMNLAGDAIHALTPSSDE